MITDSYIFKEPELSLVHELEEIRSQVKDLKARESEIRSEILGMMNNSSHGLTAAGSQVITVQVQHRRTVNSTKLEALFPDVYAQVIEEKQSTVLKLG